MKTYIKFTCLYCGQHMECEPRFCGRQMQCPACLHRIVIPLTPAQKAAGLAVKSLGTWDTWVPKPSVLTPTRYHDRTAMSLCIPKSSAIGGGRPRRSADFQSAVSPISNRQSLATLALPGTFHACAGWKLSDTADWKSVALQDGTAANNFGMQSALGGTLNEELLTQAA